MCLQHSDPALAVLCFQMALSAASPFYRGYVSDIDCRWGVISASVDDRTREERGLEVRNDFFLTLIDLLYHTVDVCIL